MTTIAKIELRDRIVPFGKVSKRKAQEFVKSRWRSRLGQEIKAVMRHSFYTDVQIDAVGFSGDVNDVIRFPRQEEL